MNKELWSHEFWCEPEVVSDDMTYEGILVCVSVCVIMVILIIYLLEKNKKNLLLPI
jgi:hypothetical protein